MQVSGKSESGGTKTYTIRVTRGASPHYYLQALSASGVSISPAFSISVSSSSSTQCSSSVLAWGELLFLEAAWADQEESRVERAQKRASRPSKLPPRLPRGFRPEPRGGAWSS